MKIVVPIHQFEIRHVIILEFSSIIKKILAPYLKLANKIQIQNENSVNERITILFEDGHFELRLFWDRIIFKTELESFQTLNENNSFIDSVFFPIVEKIMDSEGFGGLSNYVFYTLFVKFSSLEVNEIQKKYKTEYLHESLIKVLPNANDFGINIEEKDGNKSTSFVIGPYLGEEDLNKREIIVRSPNILSSVTQPGEIMEVKLFDHISSFSFREYKSLVAQTNNIVEKLWGE